MTTTTVAYTTTAPPTEATTQNIIANLKTTMPPGLAEVVEEDAPPCCSTKGGLCAWIEPPCEFLSEDDRKKQVWDDAMCNALHPDDLKEIAWRYGLFKAQQKRMLFARVSVKEHVNFSERWMQTLQAPYNILPITHSGRGL